jgi:putative MATE family efflux protein
MKLISYKQICKLAWPVTISQGIMLINGMVDLGFISPFGTDAIAAVAIANVICVTLMNFFEGFRLGTTVLVAKAAAESTKKTASIFNTALCLALAAGLIITFAAPFISDAVFKHIENSAVVYHGTSYLTYWLYVLAISFTLNTLVGLYRGLGDTFTPLYAGILLCLINAGLDYVFIYGHFGLPALGVKGSALATLAANIIGTLLLFYLLLRREKTIKYLDFRQPILPCIKEYLKLALHVGINTGLTNLALIFFMGIIGTLGTAQLAVHQITFQIFLFAYMPGMGFLITASILVPQLIGSKEYHLIQSTVTKICKISFLTILLTSGAIYLSASSISAFFSPQDLPVAQEAAKTIRLVCISQLSCAIYMVLRGALTGQKDTAFIVYEGLITAYVIFLPLAYLLAVKLGYGVFGGYIAFLIWCLSDSLSLFVRFYYASCRKAIRSEL